MIFFRKPQIKVIITFVSSLNSKITKEDQAPSNWASKEDQKHYKGILKRNNLIIISREVYIKDNIKPIKNKRYIIMTREPEKYKNEEIKGHLEFTSENPSDLIKRLEYEGYKKVLLSTGANLTAQFLKENLVDEIYLTIEPQIFSNGLDMISPAAGNINLKLLNSKRLNKRGTLLLHYKILKSNLLDK